METNINNSTEKEDMDAACDIFRCFFLAWDIVHHPERVMDPKYTDARTIQLLRNYNKSK